LNAGAYATYSAFKTAANAQLKESNAKNVDPLYISNTDLHVQNTVLNAAAPVQTLVSVDYDGQTRNASTPDIGADEFNPPANDAGVVSIDNPTATYCAGVGSVVVTIANYGASNLTSASIGWSVNGTVQTPFSWNGTITPGNTLSSVTIGTFNFASNQVYNFKAWTYNPNGGVDGLALNDTSYKNNVLQGMNGTYTIGGTSPDYPTFQSALNDLYFRGVCGSVVFNVRDGLYNEQLTLNSIPNTSTSNTVTFQSQSLDSTKVRLWVAASSVATNNYVVGFNGADFVTFNKMTIWRMTNNTYSTVIDYKNASNNNRFTNCIIRGNLIASTGTNYAIINEANQVNAALADTANSFINNRIVAGSYGAYILGAGALGTYERSWRFTGNRFDSCYYMSLYLSSLENVTITNNQIYNNTTYTAGYGIYATSIYNASAGQRFTVSGNKIWNLYGGYGIYLATVYSASNTLINPITNNFVNVATAGANTAYGMYVSLGGQLQILNNTFNVNTASFGSATGYGCYLASLQAVANNTVIMNNIFANSSTLASTTSMGFQSTTSAGPYVNVTTGFDRNCFWHAGTAGSVYLMGWNGAGPYTSASAITTGFAYYKASYPTANILSVVTDPQFANIANNDLHVGATAYLLKNRGLSSTLVTTDIDGANRDATPDLGADEFTCTTSGIWLGITNNWNTTSNWSNDVIPTSSNAITINPINAVDGGPGTLTSPYNGQSTYPTVTSNCAVSSLTINVGATTNVTSVTINSGVTLTSSGAVSNSSTMTVNGGLSCTTLTNNTSSTVTVASTGSIVGSGNFANTGTINNSGSISGVVDFTNATGTYVSNTGSSISSTGTFTSGTAITFNGTGSFGVVNNTAALTVASGTGTRWTSTGLLTNSGASGAITFNGTASVAGITNSASTNSVTIGGITVTSSGAFTNSGSFILSTASGAYSGTSFTNNVGSTFTNGNASTNFTLTGSFTNNLSITANGVYSIGSTVSNTTGTVTVASGTGTRWTSGAITNNNGTASFVFNANASIGGLNNGTSLSTTNSVTIGASSTVTSTGAFSNYGTFNLTGAGASYSGTTFTNNTGTVFSTTGNTTGTFTLTGLFTNSITTALTFNNIFSVAAVNNTAQVTVASGTGTRWTSSGLITNSGSGSFIFSGAASLAGLTNSSTTAGFTINGVAVSSTGDISNTGLFNMSAAGSSFSGTNFTNNTGATLGGGGVFAGNFTLTGTFNTLSGMSITANGVVNIGGAITNAGSITSASGTGTRWTSSSLVTNNGSGSLTLNGASSLAGLTNSASTTSLVIGGAAVTSTGAINNSGTFTMSTTGGSFSGTSFTNNAGSVFNNGNSSTSFTLTGNMTNNVTFTANGVFSMAGLTNTAGIITIPSGTGTRWTNSGAISNNATINFNGTSSIANLTNTASGTSVIAASNTVTSSGNISNSGTFTLNGRITCVDYTNASGSLMTSGSASSLWSSGTFTNSTTNTVAINGNDSFNDLTNSIGATIIVASGSSFKCKGTISNNGSIIFANTNINWVVNLNNYGTYTTNTGSTVDVYGDFDNIGGTLNLNNSLFELKKNGTQSFDGTAFYDLKIVGTGVKTLLANATIRHSLVFNSNSGSINTITNSAVITMDTTATITETNSSLVLGTVQMLNKHWSNGSQFTFGGMGVDLTQGNFNLGATSVVRTTGSIGIQTGSGNSGIARAWDITPQHDSALGRNGTFPSVVFHYNDNTSELNGLTESTFIMFRSEDGGSTWQNVSNNSTLSTSNNTITKTKVDHFSKWTIGSNVTPLPVKLKSFTATLVNDNDVNVEWTTAQEINNDHFDVERSTDGVNFSKIAEIAGNGTTFIEHSYSKMDENVDQLLSPVIYYRLRQVDNNGVSEYSDIRMVNLSSITIKPAVKVWYNDGEQKVYVKLAEATSQEVSIRLTDGQGKTISTSTINANTGYTQSSISVEGLAKGIYNVIITTNTGTETQRVMKY